MRRSAEIVMPMISEDVHEIRQKNTTLDFCLIGKFILCTRELGFADAHIRTHWCTCQGCDLIPMILAKTIQGLDVLSKKETRFMVVHYCSLSGWLIICLCSNAYQVWIWLEALQEPKKSLMLVARHRTNGLTSCAKGQITTSVGSVRGGDVTFPCLDHQDGTISFWWDWE